MSGFVLWLTGLSGAGKSTITERLVGELAQRGRSIEVLDGDEVRTNLSKGLGFSKEDRDTNIRRIGYVARLLARNGASVVTAAISPYRAVRDEVRAQTPHFVEVYVKCSIDELVRRDVKGLYKKALAGEIPNFTGISDPYEEPLNPEIAVDTERETLEESVAKILRYLERAGFIRPVAVTRLLGGSELAEGRALAALLPRLDVTQREASDVYMLGSGALAPLTGFIGSADYASVVESGRLAAGHPFTIPIVLRIDDDQRRALRSADRVGLWVDGAPVAILDVAEIYALDPENEALGVYGTAEDAHPGVRLLRAGGRWAVAGEVTALGRPESPWPQFDLTPQEVSAEKARRGWRTMVGFQTRNPVHRAHEYLQKVALETVDGLLLHPLVGETKEGDVPAAVRMQCYETLLEGYYPNQRALLATNPAWMRYAGPREAVFHALVRRNYGCTHFIVGRDHAGVGSYYDTYAAHRIFEQFTPKELGIEILTFEHAFYCTTCHGMASTRTCPHPAEARVAPSGTRVREQLSQGQPLPREFTRPELADVLARAYRVA
ncbi:MAG: sulfate adenylyltransferase [bacterium]|nr:sulfate adenylyltransferase [bacterium]